MARMVMRSSPALPHNTESSVLWGTPGTKKMPARVKVVKFLYNGDLVRNGNSDVEDALRWQA